ncbi:MAG: acetyl-CoA decarbonylase/synthase complex subunit gamma [Armatimonadetes bacterium]|nr:acetyl-CoA decarbonylase/synthase complex subunit gamma [Armatimonadota bacterium]NIM23570.1 acetyl-CoA decarbonylase/synthase complex subunit gamma [Armatimonadota bacterium]NIM67436.1 acetyl-CoA decarbonylase/synthase complex subunit gamma [Armatimonadota bacterium]NIM75937.1 acetyl-CoA decarbonylase/synthase complex subunit gamma [Armatimonadota bacterium]NIN05622.1 acetyl-CoA decarbonylase/synthase complex subunit gamma [Armatimonadota bacterium]
MALTGLEIYKHLPKTNCRDCGVPTCLAFAMKLAQKQATLDQCPHATDEAKAALEGAAQPPIKLISIGADEKKVELGNETVLFRHEETFHHPTGIAVMVDASMAEAELLDRVRKIGEMAFERVGQNIAVNLIALRGEGAALAEAAAKITQNSPLPLILISEDAGALEKALEKCGAKKPLIYAATEQNVEQLAPLAKKFSCPLAIKAEGLEALAALSEKAQSLGAADLVLDSGAREPVEVLAHQTSIRRAALRKKFRAFGFPTICLATGKDASEEALLASQFIAKYAGIVVLDKAELWSLLPVLTARQNIYTDPQKPIQIAEGLYQIGTPDENSPVLVTTNFSLTYFTVEGDVEASKVSSWVVVVNTEGTSVLTAWASDKFNAEIIAENIKKAGVDEKAKHRKIIIPGYVAVLSGKLEELSGWKIMVGPRESSGIPSYLRNEWQAAA